MILPTLDDALHIAFHLQRDVKGGNLILVLKFGQACGKEHENVSSV